MLYHFILTRFNLPLWTEDKNGSCIERESWLEERLNLFETYCLPSVMNQSNQNFIWVLLCDENTPIRCRGRIKAYKEQCSQIELIQVEEGYAWDFPRIFSDVVTTILEEKGAEDGDNCLTTYLDNDDALHRDYVKNIQDIAASLYENTFVSFDYGLQYFTELNVATRVKYSNNHFMTLYERVNFENNDYLNNPKTSLSPVRTCYGYGSHFLLEQKGISVHHITSKEHPMWVEVIHHDNVDNDVKMTFDTKIINNPNMLRNAYSINIDLSNSRCGYGFRVFSQMFRRAKEKLITRKWK